MFPGFLFYRRKNRKNKKYYFSSNKIVKFLFYKVLYTPILILNYEFNRHIPVRSAKMVDFNYNLMDFGLESPWSLEISKKKSFNLVYCSAFSKHHGYFGDSLFLYLL